jgi:hypothetical protein
MKISVEAKVAAAVAIGFVALTVGAVARENGAGQTGGANSYGPTNSPGVNSNMSQQAYTSNLRSNEVVR